MIRNGKVYVTSYMVYRTEKGHIGFKLLHPEQYDSTTVFNRASDIIGFAVESELVESQKEDIRSKVYGICFVYKCKHFHFHPDTDNTITIPIVID